MNWQQLKISFIGTWENSCKRNIELLREYLGNMDNLDTLHQVYGYLTKPSFSDKLKKYSELEHLLSEIRSNIENLK